MSIWSSVGEPVSALNGDSEDANYRAEGDPSLSVDVATATPWHDHIRLAIFGQGVDTDALLSPAAAAQLRDKLNAALEVSNDER